MTAALKQDGDAVPAHPDMSERQRVRYPVPFADSIAFFNHSTARPACSSFTVSSRVTDARPLGS
ncbi:hypothetical protein BCAR13_100178 [Paraburkholderia caribensis]|nr:hypothetical protein BCAR13_100178 [Paraburkholderia caribensis]